MAAAHEQVRQAERAAKCAAVKGLGEGQPSPYALPRHLMNPLEARIGYKFRNSLLLAEAMTHPSLSMERRDYPFDNQRLEFLGDAVVQLVFTEFLYRQFPGANEGQMTKMRTCLVSRRALCEIAAGLELGRYLMMGRGEEANGGRQRESNLADAFEALVGAIYLDGGFEAARRFVLAEAEAALADVQNAPSSSNPKGALQESLQALGPDAPVYELLSESGPEHSKQFLCRVVWRGMELACGTGQSKKEAEIAAAKAALAGRLWEAAGGNGKERKEAGVQKQGGGAAAVGVAAPGGVSGAAGGVSAGGAAAPVVAAGPLGAAAPVSVAAAGGVAAPAVAPAGANAPGVVVAGVVAPSGVVASPSGLSPVRRGGRVAAEAETK